MNQFWQTYSRQIAFAGAVGVGLALFLWPDRKPVPEVLDNVYCAAEAAALHEYADQRATSGEPLDPTVAERVTAHNDQAQDYLRGLRRRDDPAVVQIPVDIASARTTRDATLARDPDGYVDDVLSRIDICVPKLSAVSSL